MGRTVVGLDIGTTGVRAAEITLSRHSSVVRKFATAPLPAGAVRGGVVIDAVAVGAVLKELWSKAKFDTRTVSVGIANEGVLVRQMDLDWMPPADFRKAVRYLVADALPVPIEEANLAYHVIGEFEVPDEQGGEPRRVVRILFVAAAREVVDGFVTAIHHAGLRVTRADLLPFALLRLSSPDGIVPDGPVEAVIDIGADTVGVTVHCGGQPRFVRMIPGLGSGRITVSLQEKYGWTWEDAERTKIMLGLPGSEPAGPVEPSAEDHPAQQLISQQVGALITELRTTLAFVRSSGAEPRPLSRILLAGAGSRLPGLVPRLSSELGVPVEMLTTPADLNIRARLRLTGEGLTHLLAPAGLCLGVPAR